MNISPNGLALIKHFEGFRAAPYRDGVGVWTIGYGHTGPGTAYMRPLTPDEASHLLNTDLSHAEMSVLNLVQVALTQGQFDALCSFVYNLGHGSLAISTLLRDVNKGNYAAAAGQFIRWDHAGYVIEEGLLLRRQAEAKMFQGLAWN